MGMNSNDFLETDKLLKCIYQKNGQLSEKKTRLSVIVNTTGNSEASEYHW